MGQAPILLKKFDKRACNHLYWSPSGQFIVLAGLGSNGGGSLEFVDTHDFLVMNTTDHFQMSDVEWDPTGRYVITGVSFWKTKVDTGKQVRKLILIIIDYFFFNSVLHYVRERVVAKMVVLEMTL